MLGKISLIKRTQQQTLIFTIMCVSLCINFWSQILHLPSAVKYLADIGWVLLFGLIMLGKRKHEVQKGIKILGIIIFAFYFYAVLNYIVNYQNIIYFIWGTRNTFRFYVFLYACILYLDKKNIDSILKILDRLFYVNIILVAFQFFVEKLQDDYVGGFFGVEKGCNAYLNNYFVALTIIYLIEFYHKKIGFIKAVTRILLMGLCCALAEIKIFYVELAIILLLFALFTKFSLKKALIIILSILGIVIGVKILIDIYPNFSEIFTVKNLIDVASSDKGYTGANDFNRLNSITMANMRFFDTTPQKTFGFGLGNCDYADGKAFLTTNFFVKYQNLHYTWLSYAMIYLELGYIGLAFYYSVLVFIAFLLLRRLKNGNYNPMYVEISFIASIMMVFISIYNSSLRTESGYLLFFVLSIGFIPNNK